MLHRVILTAASVVALATAANAADMYRPSAGGYKDVPYVGVNWSGLYAGVNGGYGWDASKIHDGLLFDIQPEGGFGGGQIGYNVQRGNIVFGLEADLQGAGITDSKSNADVSQKSTLDWFGTVRGRVGYTVDRALVYATGGFAYGHIKDKGVSSTTETDSTGYAAGGGVEYKFNPNWSAKAEYQYINLGQDSYFAKITGEDFAVHTVRAGLNYHVGTSYEPLK